MSFAASGRFGDDPGKGGERLFASLTQETTSGNSSLDFLLE